MLKSKSLVFTQLILLILILCSCRDAPNEPLRIASSPWPGYEPLYLARDLGYLDQKKVNLFELPSSDINMESFRNSSTDLATLTLDETLDLLHSGTRLKVVAVMDISHGGDAVLVHPSIKQLSDLRGKRISIVNIPLGLYMLNRLLDKAGLDRNDVSVYPMPETKQLSFYTKGNADVVITFEPVKTKLIQAGAKVIFDSSMIPNEIFDLLVIHEDVFSKRRSDVCEVVKGWFKALEYIQKQPVDAALRISRRLAVEPEAIPKMMEGIILPSKAENKRILGGDTPELIKPARILAEIMLKENMISNLVDPSVSIDRSFTSCY